MSSSLASLIRCLAISSEAHIENLNLHRKNRIKSEKWYKYRQPLSVIPVPCTVPCRTTVQEGVGKPRFYSVFLYTKNIISLTVQGNQQGAGLPRFYSLFLYTKNIISPTVRM